MLRVSNIAHLLTKPDQVAKAGRLERKPKQPSIKSSTSPKPKRKQNKEVKTSLLAKLQQSCNTLVTSFSSILSNFHNASSGISSVAHHNPHINAVFVQLPFYAGTLPRQNTLLSVSDKPRLHQLKIITSSSSIVQASLLPECFHPHGEIPSRKGKYPC